MATKVFDKAEWHLENPKSYSKEDVVNYFQQLFNWLEEKGMLNPMGKELLEDIDASISLNTKLLTPNGIEFLEKYYDTFLQQVDFKEGFKGELMEEFFNKSS